MPPPSSCAVPIDWRTSFSVIAAAVVPANPRTMVATLLANAVTKMYSPVVWFITIEFGTQIFASATCRLVAALLIVAAQVVLPEMCESSTHENDVSLAGDFGIPAVIARSGAVPAKPCIRTRLEKSPTRSPIVPLCEAKMP